MSVAIFDALASASARVSSRCWIGRSWIMLSPCSKSNSAVAVRMPRSAVGTYMLVAFTCSKSIFNTLNGFTNGVLSASHVYIINMCDSEKDGARLELLVVRRESESKASRGIPELQWESSWRVFRAGA
eukprot:9500288-Pyramimonas_sp.AAC.1